MKKLYPILTVIMIASLVLSACGASPAPSDGAQPAPTEASVKPAEKPAAKPTQPPAPPPAENPTTAPAQSEALDLSSVTSGLSELDSYKTSFNMTFDGTKDSKPVTGTLAFTEEFVKEPAAKRTTITGLGAILGAANGQGDNGSIQTIEVGGKQYSKLGDICTQATAESGPKASAMFDPSTIIGDVRGAQKVGNETVNGMPTEHYKIDTTSLETLGYANAQGDVWVAQPGNFVVKYTFAATGKDQFFGSAADEGNIKWVYEVTDVNQPIVIQPPEKCSGAAEDIPMMTDAQDQAAMGDMTAYTSPTKFEDVVTFYEKEMKAKGWTATEDSGMSTEGASMKTYTKDGRTVQVMITADQSSGKTSVVITEEKK